MEHYGRNTVWGFSERTLKNLAFLEAARRQGVDVHVVAQLTTSLLGLIVFPYQEICDSKYTEFRKIKLADLEAQGWPSWRVDIGKSKNFHDHIRHLRNAISHRRVYFSSDSRDPSEVEIHFRDCADRNGPWDWGAIIWANALQDFVSRFAIYLRQWERDYS
jgi:hypothetical protein